jgi:hypothetical protein
MWHFCTQCCFVIRPLYFLQIMTEAHVQVKLKLDSLCLCRMSDLTFFKQTPEAHLIREVWVLSLHQFRDISTPLRRSRSTCLFAVDAQDVKVAASSPLAPSQPSQPLSSRWMQLTSSSSLTCQASCVKHSEQLA